MTMKQLKSKIKVTVEKTDTGFSAYANDYAVFTTGNTLTELRTNMVEAMNLHYEEKNVIVSPDNIDLKIDLKQFFSYYRVLNTNYLANRINMNKTLLSQYVNGKKKPSTKQTLKIMKGVNEIGKELSEINII